MIWRCGRFRMDVGARPLIMGILNITSDSFSDGYPHPDQALRHALHLVAEGADIIDVGGESTRPGSDPVSAELELSRVLPVIERLRGEHEIPISIDTQKPEVAARALEAGAVIVNHVSATLEPEAMVDVLRQSDAGYIAMHMRDRPKVMQKDVHYEDVTGEVREKLRLVGDGVLSAGVAPERLLFDPGIGFGKKLAHNLVILRGLDELSVSLGRPLVLGVSRKSWLDHLLDVPHEHWTERDAYTLVATVLVSSKAVAVHRVHNVGWCRKALILQNEMKH